MQIYHIEIAKLVVHLIEITIKMIIIRQQISVVIRLVAIFSGLKILWTNRNSSLKTFWLSFLCLY